MSEFNKELFLQNLKDVNTTLKQLHICVDNILKLSNDVAGGDSELQEQVDELNQNLETLTSNVYTKTESDTLFGNKVSKNEIGYFEFEVSSSSGTLTDEQFAECLKPYCIIYKGGNIYYKIVGRLSSNVGDYLTFCRIPYLNTYHSDYEEIYNDIIQINKNTKEYTVNEYLNKTFYSKSQIDALLNNKQNTLVDSGDNQNIKTINNQSLLGSGNIELSGMKLTKLWENPSPTSIMSVQTVDIDLTKYKFILIQFVHDTSKSYPEVNTQIFNLENLLSGNWLYPRLNYMDNNGVYYRTINVSFQNNTIQFASATFRAYSDMTTFTSGDKYCVPWTVYGFEE